MIVPTFDRTARKSQRFGRDNLQAKKGPYSGPSSSLTTKQFNQADAPFSSGISTSQRFGQANIQLANKFDDRKYLPPSAPVNSRAYLPPRGYLPPQKEDFSFQ